MIEHLRSYEVSIWTLQDSLITVLKPSNLEHKGQIVEPMMTLKDDGENKFSFKIPMYIEDEYGVFKENPIWYNIRDGIIISGLRKLKVIFNKTKPEEEVYEFMIINVKEQHEGKKKYCEVESEGLAFHELGKQGYKIAFEGGDEIYYEQKAFFEGTSSYLKCPEPTIDYWANKVFRNTNWRYSVQMDYTGFSNRDSHKIYEEPYVTSWNLNETGDNLIPSTVTELTEKTRLIEAKESNRYNLSQTIAETFQVYCKYKYHYDENYHIIDREVIFYNNFLNESQGVIDLTYKYNTEHLTRIMDSSDLITKMFVRSLTDKDMPSGETIISETAANKSGEDYILNFDYLYNIGAISQEQYDEIEPYQKKLGVINKEYNELVNDLIEWSNEKLKKQEARKKTAEDALAMTIEALNNAKTSAGRFLTTGGTETITITERNPHTMYAIPNGGTYYCNFKIDGINSSTVKLYKSYDTVTHTMDIGSEIKNFILINDEYGNVIKAENITGLENSYTIYATFTYTPKLYYDNIINSLSDRYSLNEGIIIDATNNIEELKNKIKNAESRKKELLEEKNNIIDSFERLMGPSLREGTWQPEDEYSGYGETHEDSFTLIGSSTFNNSLCSIGWDEELFDDEQDIKYLYGIELETKYYSCVRVPSNLDINSLEKLTFVYLTGNNSSSKQYMVIDSKMSFCFLKSGSTVIPALILLDKTPTVEQLRTGYLAYVSLNNGIINETRISGASFIENVSNYKLVYPRIKINSNLVKSYQTEVYIKKNNILLENYKDFYIFYRNKAYYITLKPHVLVNEFGSYTVQYAISNSALAIYLDALKVLKENSFPKVSYEIDIISANKNFIYNAYQHLGQIAHINDYEFKFNNVMGYISELNLDLDKPWQDKVVIKNYKTKFEDLFSTIVAQTEQMKKNSALINIATSAFNADGSLNDTTFSDLLSRLPDYSTEATSPEIEYLKYEPYIRQKLKETYIEAGKILSAAQQSINAVDELNPHNADILGSFQEDIRSNLTPTNFKLGEFSDGGKYNILYNVTLNSEADFFKVGDILTYGRKVIEGSKTTYIEDIYVATENKNQITYTTTTEWKTSLKGWSLVHDGSLAQIKGANLDINAKTGKIQILAENEINIASGGLLKLAGENIKIIGNKTVEIGGPDIKIYSANTGETANTSKGIHIYASSLGSGTSAVDVMGKGIEMRAANGLVFKSGKGIDFVTSDNDSTSVLSIDKNKGIYLGSNNSITFYSGSAASSSGGSAASVQINKDRILFGVSNSATGTTAVDLTKDHIIFGAGNVVNSNLISNVGISQSGVQITKDAIKMASGSESNRSYFILDKDKVEFGIANNVNSGAYIKLSKDGKIIIGSAANVKTDSSTGFKTIENTTARFEVYAPNFIVDSYGHLYANEAHISGSIEAKSGKIGGWTIEEDKLYYYTNTPSASSLILSPEGIKSTASIGGSPNGTENKWAFTIKDKFGITTSGKLYATEAKISGDVTANAVTADISISSPSITGGIISGTIINNANQTFHVDSLGNLTAKSVTITGGNQTFSDPATAGFKIDQGKIQAKGVDIDGIITARSGKIGGWIIKNYGLYSDNTTDFNGRRIRISGNSNYTWPLAIGAKYVSTNSSSNDDGDGEGKWVWSSAPFRVNNEGTMYCTNAEITGGNFSINCSKDFQIYNPDTDKYDITWAYRGKVSINKNFKVADDDLYANSPCPLYIEENFNNNKSYTYLWNGQLRFASKNNGSYNTMISNSGIETSLIEAYYIGTGNNSKFSGLIDLHGNSVEIMDFSDTSDSTHNIIKMTTNKNNVGLSVTMKTDNDFYSQEKWLIRKNKNGEIYIDGIVHVRNSNGDWIEISG